MVASQCTKGIVLADGTRIDEFGEVHRPAPEVKKDKSGLDIVRVRRVDELPKNGRAYAVIAAMELWGLNFADIAETLDKQYQDIVDAANSEGYKTFRQEIVDSVLEAETQDVRHIFVQNAARAAKGMVALMDSDVPEVRQIAHKEVLDRGGFRPADIIEHRHKVENDLRITYVSDKDIKTIDADFVDIVK